MSNISSTASSTWSSILTYLSPTASSSSTASQTDSTSDSSTAEATDAADNSQGNSVVLLKAQNQLSLIGTLLGSTTLLSATMEQLALSAENFKILGQSGVLKTHPELIGSLFNTGSSSQTTTSSGSQTVDSSGTSGSTVDVVA